MKALPISPSGGFSRPLRIGLIGAGWVTQHHLAGWQRQAGRARVVAITDPNQQRARERATAFSIDEVYEDAGDLFKNAEVDAVDIAAPREAHEPLVRLAAEHGLPILCQKPLAPTHAAAEALVRSTGHVRLMVHENWRFRPYYRQIAEWLGAGRIGAVVQAQMTLLSSGLIPDERGVLPALERQPFLVSLDRALVMEILIHHIDTLRFLLGDLKVVHARTGKTCSAIKGEDRAAITFEGTQGATVMLLSNLLAHGQPAALVDRLTLIGEKGVIRLAGNNLVCEGASPAELQYDLAACYLDSYTATISHFLDCLASGAPFETSPEDNLQTLRLVEDIYIENQSITRRP